jgi:hypothetical protein
MGDLTPAPPSASLTTEQAQRWNQLLWDIAEAITPGPRLVVVDGNHQAAAFAARLAETVAAIGQECARLSDQNPTSRPDNCARLPRRRSTTAPSQA